MKKPPTLVKASVDDAAMEAALDVVVRAITERVVARVIHQLGAAVAADYTSLDGERPPHESRRSYAEKCRAIPEASKVGKIWYCPRAAWWAHARRPALVVVPPPAESAPDVDAMIEASGLRATRRAS